MSEVIELTMPVDPDLLMVVRFTAAAIAARAEFDLEEVEDLRLGLPLDEHRAQDRHLGFDGLGRRFVD